MSRTIGALFWRHGYKDREHELIFDPPLLDEQKHLIEQVNNAVLIYGKPDLIISSPLMRTVQTSNIIKKILNENGYNVDVVINNKLHEIMYREVTDEMLSSDTLAHLPNGINENEADKKNRCYDIIFEIVKQNKDSKIWIVSHCSLIKRLTKFTDYKIKKIDEGSFIYLSFNNDKLKKAFMDKSMSVDENYDDILNLI